MLDVLERMMLPAEGCKKRENSHRVARRIVVARKGKEKVSGIVFPPFFFSIFRADDVKPRGMLYSAADML